MTMKQIAPFLLVAALSACGQSETPKQATNVPTVEELVADPARLRELRRQCKTGRPTMGDVLCISPRVSEQQLPTTCGFHAAMGLVLLPLVAVVPRGGERGGT